MWTWGSLAGVTLLGFASKCYIGPAAAWVNNALSGVFYEIFWCLVVLLVAPRSAPWLVALGVFGTTCGLEVLQLWHPAFLEHVRGFFLGRTLLGTTFAWLDFPHYAVGCGLGWLWMRWLQGARWVVRRQGPDKLVGEPKETAEEQGG